MRWKALCFVSFATLLFFPVVCGRLSRFPVPRFTVDDATLQEGSFKMGRGGQPNHLLICNLCWLVFTSGVCNLSWGRVNFRLLEYLAGLSKLKPCCFFAQLSFEAVAGGSIHPKWWWKSILVVINTFIATFISNFYNFTCVDQFRYGDRFLRSTILGLRTKRRGPHLQSFPWEQIAQPWFKCSKFDIYPQVILLAHGQRN